MGKGGKKKKAKITGTPDVVKFKQTREFFLLKECVSIQESLPFVAVDALDALSFKKVARFLNMVGLLAEFLGVDSKKDYRFNYHHKYLAPVPQFFPFGYDVEVIRAARQVQERDKPCDNYNGKEYPYPEELRALSEKFLKDVDSYMTKIASEIEPRLKDDFATGLKRFKWDLKEDIQAFDKLWMSFEQEYCKAKHTILNEVFEPIDRLVTIEMQLSQAEDRLDIESKQRLEQDFVNAVEEYTYYVFGSERNEPFPDEVIALSEACIFYETKCSEEWLQVAKHLIKDYLELRIFIMKIPEERIKPELKDNQTFMRLLKAFQGSVLAAREPLAFVAQLPKLINAKTSDWMTRKLLEPDLRYIQKTQQLSMEAKG
eukprot:gnl/TRDRNA2_/TRDRNA2_130441_c1_seq2.p1 gnl/TRDRNA2_/TRDRNA2_130441_c1~~gnl/TRDRNA2_/TRDRNA2_130441_c1_seq2.p1  ORF type:complete len:372 (-),score=108.28 gnl/TRDRNA2_/TRDRNA2_130441_c1_seq2:155-1270(-)